VFSGFSKDFQIFQNLKIIFASIMDTPLKKIYQLKKSLFAVKNIKINKNGKKSKK
jgi:hypothetical protein